MRKLVIILGVILLTSFTACTPKKGTCQMLQEQFDYSSDMVFKLNMSNSSNWDSLRIQKSFFLGAEWMAVEVLSKTCLNR